jgi:glucosyl-dolichyl phosphate glucuronosyltransferase
VRTSIPVDASVIICAYTEARWDDLRTAVASVERQHVAPIEIIVVIDHNLKLLQLAQAEMQGITVLENQDSRGLSGARNSGVRAAKGSLIAFLDDDAVAEADWLESLVCACNEPNVLGCGGLVQPAWHGTKPSWFPEEFNWVVGCSYRGLPDIRCAVRNLIGSSMCICREVFDSIGYFRTDVGRIDKHPVGCEETELCIRAQQRWPEGAFLYEPASRIRHVVPKSRATWTYFCSRCFFEGRSKAQVARLRGVRDGLSSERAYTISVLPKGVMRNLAQALVNRDVYGLCRAGVIVAGLAMTTSGYLSGALNKTLGQWKVWLHHAVRALLPGPAAMTSSHADSSTWKVTKRDVHLQ